MLRRLDLVWANLDLPAGRRPVCILTRDAAIPVLNAVVCAPITRRIRNIASEVRLDADAGLGVECAISFDALLTVAIDRIDGEAVGHLPPDKAIEVDRAARFALDLMW